MSIFIHMLYQSRGVLHIGDDTQRELFLLYMI